MVESDGKWCGMWWGSSSEWWYVVDSKWCGKWWGGSSEWWYVVE